MNKRIKNILILTAVAVVLFTGCKRRPVKEVSIVYTNDVHSYIDNSIKNKETSEIKPALRFSRIAAMVKSMRADGKEVILVDAGDQIQGTSNGSIDNGKTIIKIMNAAGYELSAVGNHEFDYGVDTLFNVISGAKFPYLSCNFYKKDGRKVTKPFDPYKIINIGNRKIAFIGISTPETITSSTPVFFQNENGEFIYFIQGTENASDLYESVQNAIDSVRKKADVVIALGHVGIGMDEQKKGISSIAVIENTKGLDAFIDGHSHTRLESKIVKDKSGKDVILTQSGSYLKSFGCMTISSDGKIETELLDTYDGIDDDTAAIEAELIEKVQTEYGKQIAVLDSQLYVSNPENEKQRLIRSREMNAGDFIADTAYWYFNESKQINCDIAIANGGGIRTFVKPGVVTKNDMKNVEPFGNMICLINATGQQIKDCLEMGTTVTGEYDKQWNCPAENGGFMHVAGLRYTINSKVPSKVKVDEKGMFSSVDGEYRVENIEVYNRATSSYEPLDLTKTYAVGGVNYILRNSGNGCSMFADCETIVDFVGQDLDVTIAYINAFAKDGDYPKISTANSPLKIYGNYLLDYENPFGAGRITIK